MAYNYYQDPNQGWYDNMYAADPSMHPYEEPQEEDTESQKLKKDQEMIEEIESNRLYLRKVRKRCVQEDFADLEKTQMFLFEFLIESLEVNAKSELGLIPETIELSDIVAKVQFLDTPCLEIKEKGEKIDGSDSVLGQNEYLETVGNAGLEDTLDPGKMDKAKEESPRNSMEKVELSSSDKPVDYDTKWENSSGKSLLFSKTALEIIQGLDHSPIKVQVCRCVGNKEDEEKYIYEPLGYTQVRLPDHFSLSVLQSCKAGVILPVSCIYRETCVLKNVFGVRKGELQVFVRLSCFGKVITTSFQSVGRERRYMFKPSPQPNLENTESEIQRDTLLKPIVAEEDVAVGISVVKDEDVFQKTVVWRNNPQKCEGTDFISKFNRYKDWSLRMPRPSDVELCRNAIPQGKDKPFCDWHNLVSKEIKNSPGRKCGCVNSMNVKSSKTFRESSPVRPLAKELTYKSPIYETSSDISELSRSKPSRVDKIGPPRHGSPSGMKKVPEVPLQPFAGLGIPSEPTDCNCDCNRIKNTLAIHPMMKYTWQVK